MAPRRRIGRPASSVPAAFPSELKRAREALGWDIELAAERNKVAKVTYYSWESGARAPRPSQFPLIAAAMNTTVAALFGERAA